MSKTKRLAVSILTLAILICGMLVLASCGKGDDPDEGNKKPSSCSHSWQEATCEAPKTCSKCGKTDGKALSHNFAAATCKAPKTCKTCGKTEGSTLAHTGGSATCKDLAVCKKCGTAYGSLNKSNHTGTVTWFKKVDSHYGSYNCCGEKTTDKEAHNTVDGICSVCGFNPTVSAETEYSASEREACVTIFMQDNPGIVALLVELKFEDSFIWIESVENGSALNGFTFTQSDKLANGCKFMWDAVSIEDNAVESGKLLTVVFNIGEGIPAGNYNVNISVTAVDNDLKPIPFKVTNGVITVSE